MDHLSRTEFLRVFNVEGVKTRKCQLYNRIYNKVTEEWTTPEEWFRSSNKTIKIDNRVSDCYWVIWSMKFEVKLPIEFIKSIRPNYALRILENYLKDYDKFVEACKQLAICFSESYIDAVYSIVLRLCLYTGRNSLDKIKIADIAEAFSMGLTPHDGYRMKISNLLFYMGYIDAPCRDHTLYINKETLEVSKSWDERMQAAINRFINNLLNSSIEGRKMQCEKQNALNLFADWVTMQYKQDQIQDMLFLDREAWIMYITYIIKIDKISGKAKETKLLAVKDFIKWAQVKEPSVVPTCDELDVDDIEYNIEHQKVESLAFEVREHGEKIIQYLINDFKPQNIRDQFRKEAIIILANSGMRISELRRLPMDSCFFSKDEGVYKIVGEQTDKLNQKNRPIYLTKAGYEAIKRVEALRIEHDILKEKVCDRGDDSYIHLFEYQGSCPINKTSMYDFLDRVKRKIGLVNDDGSVIKGGLHAYRHFFAVTIFLESNYNIGVVRYFLGHKSYDMTYQYLDRANEILGEIERSQESIELDRISGKGIDTLIDILINDKKTKNHAYNEILKQSKNLSELISKKYIKRVGFGYCLNPCDNASRCIRCSNFLLSSRDSDDITKACVELFDLLCFKVSQYSTIDEALKQIGIQKNLADFLVLIKEMKRLEIKTLNLPEYLGRMIRDVCI